MGTTVQKLQKIIDSKEALRQSIINKGMACDTNVPFDEYSVKVDNISTTGIVSKLVKSSVRYVRSDTGSRKSTLPITSTCPYSSDNSVTLTIVYNDGSERPLSTSDTFDISYTIPDDIVSCTSGQINQINKHYEHKSSFIDSGNTHNDVWVRTISVYLNGVEVLVGLDNNFGFTSSLGSTSLTTCVYAVENWTLKINGVKQENVFGIRVEGKYASYFDGVSLSGCSNSTTKSTPIDNNYANTGISRYYGESSGTYYYIVAGFITCSSTSNSLISNYPLISIKYTLFDN